MGTLIDLQDRRRARGAWSPGANEPQAPSAPSTAPEFYFDLACPFSYLAAERVERVLGQVHWVPVAGERLPGPGWPLDLHAEAERRARMLRLPLSWPDFSHTGFRGALRAAAYATERGSGGRFALAALRLAFCGGYDLDDPAMLSEAAAAARLPAGAVLAAAKDLGRDHALEAHTRWLERVGIRELPAIRIGSRWFEGESGLAEAAAKLAARRSPRAGSAPAA